MSLTGLQLNLIYISIYYYLYIYVHTSNNNAQRYVIQKLDYASAYFMLFYNTCVAVFFHRIIESICRVLWAKFDSVFIGKQKDMLCRHSLLMGSTSTQSTLIS